jgi:hypothetical protein
VFPLCEIGHSDQSVCVASICLDPVLMISVCVCVCVNVNFMYGKESITVFQFVFVKKYINY